MTDSMSHTAPNRIDYDSLLSEIEYSGGSCANVIRKLKDCESTITDPDGADLMPAFLSYLETRMADRDHEIERMCNHHYQGFVDSIRELLQVQQDAGALRSHLTQISQGVHDTAKKLNSQCDELCRCHDTLDNIDKSIEALQLCLPILDQYARVKRNIAEKRYYPALKTLEYLEHSQIGLIRPYAFSESLIRQIPRMRQDIKSASLTELTDFLESIRKHSVRLGAVAMKQTAEKTGMDSENLIGTAGPGAGAGNSPGGVGLDPGLKMGVARSARSRPDAPVNPFTGVPDGPGAAEQELLELAAVMQDPCGPQRGSDDLSSRLDDELGRSSNVEDLVDFGPVYRCLHIHSVLGERPAFEKHYRIQRKKQCQLSLSLSPHQQASLKNYSEFFSGVVGFFVVEDYIRHTIPSMASQNYLDELWSNTQARLVLVARTNADSQLEATSLLRLKDFTVLFGRTMRSLGFSVAGLKEMTEVVRRRYERVLATEFQKRFAEIFESDDYTAITLAGPDELRVVLNMYPGYLSAEVDSQPYPRTLPFSWMVPRIHQAVRRFIDQCRQFADNLELSHTELEDTINKATNALFSETLTECMGQAVKGSVKNLLRLIQLSVNMDELEKACGHLENHIQMVTGGMIGGLTSSGDHSSGSMSTQPPRSRLHGISLFNDTRTQAETQIYTTLNSKITEFIDLASYDAASSGATQLSGPLPPPSDYMVDLMNWLKNTFCAFTNLPIKVAQTACLSACKYIHKRLEAMLVGSQLAITEGILLQVSIDLGECEEFARAEPVPGVDSATLLLVFRDLRQLIDLIRNDDWTTFFKCYDKPDDNRYDRVAPGNAIKLLEKLRDSEKKRFTFIPSIKRHERDKRKHVEDVLKQLRDLQATAYGSSGK